jgi:glycosyltransferase involved in cell wall biosynthesis
VEVIVVDDGSTDSSLAIANSFAASNVQILAQEQSGAAAARNKALLQAQGDVVQFLDADDVLALDKIERQMRRLEAEAPDVVATSMWGRFYGSIESVEFIENADFRDYPNPIDWLIESWEGKGTMPPVSWLLPRKVVELVGPWDESLSLSDDTEYFTRVALNCQKIVFCREAKGYYRSGNNTLSGRKNRSAYESYFRVCELSTQHMLAVENSPRTRHASANLWQFFAFNAYPFAKDLVNKAEKRVAELDGSKLELGGTRALRLANALGGWKTAKRLQHLYYSLRY